MQFNVDPTYRTAVEGFSWEQRAGNCARVITDEELNPAVEEAAQTIIAASQLRPSISQMAKRDLSLIDVCYIYAQNLDREKGLATVTRLTEATTEEKILIQRTFRKLSEMFVQVNADDLKGATLLFAIHRIHDLIKSKIVALPQEKTKIQKLEEALATLVALRNKYANVPADQQTLVDQVDASIRVTRQEIAALKAEQPKAVNQ